MKEFFVSFEYPRHVSANGYSVKCLCADDKEPRLTPKLARTIFSAACADGSVSYGGVTYTKSGDRLRKRTEDRYE